MPRSASAKLSDSGAYRTTMEPDPPAQAARSLIYLTRTPNEPLVAYLAANGWHITNARRPEDVPRILKSCGLAAGLIDLTTYAEDELPNLALALPHPALAWVATINAGGMDKLGIRKLVRDYCFDYATLPYQHERIAWLVGHAWGMASLHDPSDDADLNTSAGEAQMVGTCEAMQRLFRTIRKVATTDASVFISGESGTGKELTALATHERSSRRKGPFVAINCAAIPDHLLQSELFGYERGAFSGANARKIGRVEAANGGTLFLDEIGDMPLAAQTGLLRFLQEGKIERLGGLASIPVNVRIISATHVDLEAAVRDGRFRSDLYHRLCVLRVDEPPLRERGSDIEVLAHHMLRKFGSDNRRRIRGFTPAAIQALYSYDWPGNVRELINRVRRAVVMCEDKLITPADLGLQSPQEAPRMSLADARASAERNAIESALRNNGQRIGDAAKELGISRVTLYRTMRALGIRETP